MRIKVKAETNCYKNKKNTIEVLLEWFLTTRTAATTPSISIFTLSLLKIRAFFQMGPNVCFLISPNWKKISTNGFNRCKLTPQENLSLEYEQNRTEWKLWKTVANGKCTSKIGELISIKKIIEWTTQQKMLKTVLNETYLNGLMSLKKLFDYIWSFWRTEEEMVKKRPKKLEIVKNRCFSLISQQKTNRNQPHY